MFPRGGPTPPPRPLRLRTPVSPFLCGKSLFSRHSPLENFFLTTNARRCRRMEQARIRVLCLPGCQVAFRFSLLSQRTFLSSSSCYSAAPNPSPTGFFDVGDPRFFLVIPFFALFSTHIPVCCLFFCVVWRSRLLDFFYSIPEVEGPPFVLGCLVLTPVPELFPVASFPTRPVVCFVFSPRDFGTPFFFVAGPSIPPYAVTHFFLYGKVLWTVASARIC